MGTPGTWAQDWDVPVGAVLEELCCQQEVAAGKGVRKETTMPTWDEQQLEYGQQLREAWYGPIRVNASADGIQRVGVPFAEACRILTALGYHETYRDSTTIRAERGSGREIVVATISHPLLPRMPDGVGVGSQP